MNLKSILRKKIIELSGYWIYKRNDLPRGADLYEDIANKFQVRNISVVFDVGANIGSSAKEYSIAFNQPTIYSFEPFSYVYDNLVKNTAELPNVKNFNFAFGEKVDSIEVPYLSDIKASQINSLTPQVYNTFKETKKQIVEVNTVDEFARHNDIKSIDFLKIDTEGYELNVLKGAEQMLREKKVKFIYAEIGFSETRDKTHTFLPHLIDYLFERGYLFYSLYGYNEFDPTYGAHYANALFVEKGIASV